MYAAELSLLWRHERRRLAAELQWDVARDENPLQFLDLKVFCFVVPVHRLPVEILRGLHIIFECSTPSIEMMLVCWKWHDVVWRITSVRVFLGLSTSTAPGKAKRVLRKAGGRPLDSTRIGTMEESAHSLYHMPGSLKPQRWTNLVTNSLPIAEQTAN